MRIDGVDMENAKENNRKQGADFLAENAKKEDIQVTDSGLQYRVLQEGAGATPTAESTVRAHYEGKFLSGTGFDSSYQRGEPLEFSPKQVIKGWAEGIQLMQEGAIYELFVPYELGYGEDGYGPIPPCATLHFKVELLEVK